MPSTFTWLDYRSEDREQVMQLINDLRQPEARDELGVGRVRDRLADLLFPGTSTIQTRLKYFFFIPWIYQKIEKERLFGDKAAKRARDLESQLISTLRTKNELDGLIGRYAGADVKRMASSVYWNGLSVWGIRRYDESQSEYYARLSGHYSRIRAVKQRESSYHKYDDHQHSADISNWDSRIPDAPSHFPYRANYSFELTKQEAQYLRQTLSTALHTKDSLLAFFVTNKISIPDNVYFAWNVEPDILRKIEQRPALFSKLIHARNFSVVIHGSRLLYNLLLAEKAVQRDLFDVSLVDKYQAEINDWIAEMNDMHDELSDWVSNLDYDFWSVVGTENIPSRTKNFIDGWINSSVNDPEAAIRDESSRQTIIEREWELKRRKARLHNADALQIWGGESGASRLDYRWNNPVRGFINEIVAGLGASDA